MIRGNRVIYQLFIFILVSTVYTTAGFGDFSSTSSWNNITEGGWNCINRDDPNGFHGYAVIDSINTPDPSNALKFTYPKGWLSYGEPAHCWNIYGSPMGEVWVQFYFKFSDNFYWNSVRNKISYQWIGPPNNNNHYIYVSGDQKMGFEMQGAESGTYRSNTGYDPQIERGVWYSCKVHYVLNSPGANDGIFEMWINDNKVMQYTNRKYRSASQGSAGFYELTFTPVFGGMTSQTKPEEDYLWIDYTTISASDPGPSPGVGKIPMSATQIVIE